MSELKAYKGDVTIPVYGTIADAEVYLKKEADEAIAELKAKLEDVQATAYTESVDEGMENRKLKRALWMAMANRAKAEWGHWATIWFCNTSVVLNINKSSVSQDPYRSTIKRNAAIWRNMWREIECRCLKKSEEYK